MSKPFSRFLLGAACALVFAVTASGVNPIQNTLDYLFPISKYVENPTLSVYRLARDQ